MKKILTLLSAAALLIVCVAAAIPAMAEKATVASTEWKTVKENSDVVSVEKIDKGTKLSFKNSTWGGDYLVTTTKALKLNGLYLRIDDVHLPAEGNMNINMLLSKNQGALSDTAGMLWLMNNYGSAIYTYDTNNATFTPGTTLQPVAPINRGARGLGLSVFFVRNDDGSWTVHRMGTDTKRFTLSADDVTKMFGSNDPEVYVTLSDNWYHNGPAADNSFVVTELSSGNTNGFTDHWDAWGRDLVVTQSDALTDIVIEHYGNHGAVSNLMKPVALDGLTLRDVEISYSAMFRFAKSLNTNKDNGYIAEEGKAGFLVRVDKADGNVYVTYTDGGGAEADIIGSLGTEFTKFTLQIVPQKNGDIVVYVTSDKNTEVQAVLEKADLEWVFGSLENVMVNISYSSYENENDPIKITKIAKIENATEYPVELSDAKAELADGKLTGSVEVTGEYADFTAQWYLSENADGKDGKPIDKATDSEYTIPTDLAAGDHYYYFVATVTARDGEVKTLTSNVVKYTVAGDDKPDDEKPADDGKKDDEPDDGGKKDDSPATGVAFPLTAAALAAASAGAALIVRRRRA
mgnify:CR=1 FL=1